MSKDIPYFIQVRGCINCVVSKSFKEKTGNDYGFDHEIGVGCMLRNCEANGHSLHKPFIDPEELVRLALASKDKVRIERVKNMLAQADEQYKTWFEFVGIDLPNIISKLESI